MKAVTARQMREIEQASVQAGVSLDTLMENAGLAVARAVEQFLGAGYGKRISVLIGPGNNGGDGFVAARHLAARGASVQAFLCAARPDDDPKRRLAESAGAQVLDATGYSGIEALGAAVSKADVVIDAVLGTGRARPIEEPLASALFAVLQTARPVIAIDLPTGLNSDTGVFDPFGLPADLTLMLGYPKLGAIVKAGEGICGQMRVLDIGIPDGLDTGVSTEWLTQEAATALLPDRPGDANKGNFGRAFIAAGSANYIGAALLATSAAVRSGAGLVYLATRESVYRLVAGRVEEAIYHPLPENAQGRLDAGEAVRVFLADSQDASALLIGPGLGQANDTVQFVEQLCRSLREDTPVILDADALNILSRVPGWWDRVRSPKILTPHPGEMARLMDCRVQDVQEDRPGVAADAAAKFTATVVLKGAATIITAPDGRTRVSPWVNPGLAKGGTGDVLAGLMAGIAAQMPETLFDVASLAVYLHGLAGQLARDQHGEAGMTAGDVALAIPGAFTALAP